ncbi:MAG: ECF-type sigma factor [Pseudomonadales bacterium]
MADKDAGNEPVTPLRRAGTEHDEALAEHLPIVYDELRRLAASYLRRERAGHTLQPTALVHEAYLRLMKQRAVDWGNDAQFLGVAATMMRRILVNHARDRNADKRGAGAERITLELAAEGDAKSPIDVLAVHTALERLASFDARKARVVELKFFGGLTIDEICEVLALSHATVEREWTFARAWLYDALAERDQP